MGAQWGTWVAYIICYVGVELCAIERKKKKKKRRICSCYITIQRQFKCSITNITYTLLLTLLVTEVVRQTTENQVWQQNDSKIYLVNRFASK